MAIRPFSHELVTPSTGISLETSLAAPSQETDEERKLAVCLHPWSWLGGNMDDPVLLFVARFLQTRGFYVLRYNSRGVGKSTAWPSLSGQSEADDLKAVVRWGLQNIPHISSVLLFGYSHGALIASRHPTLPAPIQTYHVLLSYPLGVRGLITAFRTSMYSLSLETLLHDPRARVLVLFGDRDEFTGPTNYAAWADKIQLEAQGEGRRRLSISKIDGGSHFWRDETREKMLHVLEAWLG